MKAPGSPQLEDGYTRIANELLDALCQAHLSTYQYEVVLCIIRKTYGYGKKEDKVSLAQIEKMTHIKRPNVCRTIKELKFMGILTVISSDNRKPLTIGLQKAYKNWSVPTVIIDDNSTVITGDNKTVITGDNHKRNKEKNLNTNSATVITGDNSEALDYITHRKRHLKGQALQDFELFWKTYGYAYGKAEAADAWLDIPEQYYDLERILEGARREAKKRPGLIAERKTPKYAQGWISSRRWEDEEIKPASRQDKYAGQSPAYIKILTEEAERCSREKPCDVVWQTYKDATGNKCHWCPKFKENREKGGL